MSQNIPNNRALAQQCGKCASAQRSKKHGSPTDPSDRSLVVFTRSICVHDPDAPSSPPTAYITSQRSRQHAPLTTESPLRCLSYKQPLPALLSTTTTMLLSTVAFLAVLGAVSAAPAPQSSNPPVSYDGRQLRFNLQLNKCLTARKVEVGSELGV